MAIDKKKRKECEALVYQTMDILDKTGANTEYYKKLFASMSDEQFYKFFKKDFPLRFHMRPFEIEPGMEEFKKAADFLKIPLFEKVYLPYLFKDDQGRPITSKPCLVIYGHLKKVQQFVAKKNAMSTDTTSRDMKTGLLISEDKNAKTSDREMEALMIAGLDNVVEEFSKSKADAMEAKNLMYNTISNMGMVSLNDVKTTEEDSLARNLLNTYLLGAHINSNILNKEYYLPHTLKERKRQISRED